MSKEDVIARDGARYWALRDLSGSPREATPIEVARSVTSWGTGDMAGEVMPGGLFSTPLVRLHGSGPRTGLRVEVGKELSCLG